VVGPKLVNDNEGRRLLGYLWQGEIRGINEDKLKYRMYKG